MKLPTHPRVLFEEAVCQEGLAKAAWEAGEIDAALRHGYNAFELRKDARGRCAFLLCLAFGLVLLATVIA